jgi:DNA-binding CsgD family transcriptional regulator
VPQTSQIGTERIKMSRKKKLRGRLSRWLGEGPYTRVRLEGQSIPVEKVIDETIELLETTYPSGAHGLRLPEEEGITVALTVRERHVIGLVADGLSNKEIGEHLFITERTVRFHLTSIFQKLGADNRAQAVAIANRLEIL